MRMVIELLDEVTREVDRETHRLGSGPANLNAVRDAVRSKIDVHAWRKRFANGATAEEDAFDSSFAALITSAHSEIALR